jgi:hypothetical protein
MAPQNFAGVPYSFFQMHNQCGDFSRLITYHKNPYNLPEDICLNLPLPNFQLAKFWRMKKVEYIESTASVELPVFKPKNLFEQIYFYLSDQNRKKIAGRLIEEYRLNEFEIVHYDAGLDLLRNSLLAKQWKKEGKKIVCCYYGSDLRVRGLIKEMDELSDLNITSEYDHLALKKDLYYLFYPYDISELPTKSNIDNEKVTIVHSPTNRKFKGTELILQVIEKIKKEKGIEFLLLENMKRSDVLMIKSKADISIDQVGGTMGGTGYGKAGLETLGMSIPTITNMTDEYAAWLPENPFVIANNAEQLYNKLMELIEDAEYRKELGVKGKQWVIKYHDYESVNNKLKELYKIRGII